MSWGKIKKALNSTVGTNEFKPLDEIFEQGIEQFKGDLENGDFIVGTADSLSDGWHDVGIEHAHPVVPAGEYRHVSHNGLSSGLYAAIIYFEYWYVEHVETTKRRYSFVFSLQDDYAGIDIDYRGITFGMLNNGISLTVGQDVKLDFPDSTLRGVRINQMIVKKICGV